MPSVHPKATPRTRNTTGACPGVYMKEAFVFESMRSSYRSAM